MLLNIYDTREKMKTVLAVIILSIMIISTRVHTANSLASAPVPTPTHILSINLSPQHSEITLNQTVNFTASVIGGKPPYSYHWYSQFESLSNPLVEVATSPNFVFTPTSTGIYWIRFSVEDSIGESNGQFLTPMVVRVYECLTPSPTIVPVSPEILTDASPISIQTPSSSSSPTQYLSSEPNHFAQPSFPTYMDDLPIYFLPLLDLVGAVLVVLVLAGLLVFLKRRRK